MASSAASSPSLIFSFNLLYYAVTEWMSSRSVCPSPFFASTTYCGHSALTCTQSAFQELMEAARAALVDHVRGTLSRKHSSHSTPSPSAPDPPLTSSVPPFSLFAIPRLSSLHFTAIPSSPLCVVSVLVASDDVSSSVAAKREG